MSVAEAGEGGGARRPLRVFQCLMNELLLLFPVSWSLSGAL